MGFIVRNLTVIRMVERKFAKWINLASLVLGTCKRTNEFFILLNFCWLFKENCPLSWVLSKHCKVLSTNHTNYVNKIKGAQNKVITNSYSNMFRVLSHF